MGEKILREEMLEPKRETVLSVPYDPKTRLPHVDLRVSARSYERHHVEVKEELVGPEDRCLKVFRVKNGSSWPVFLTLVELSDD